MYHKLQNLKNLLISHTIFLCKYYYSQNNSEVFPSQHQQISLYNRDEFVVCQLGTEFLYVLLIHVQNFSISYI